MGNRQLLYDFLADKKISMFPEEIDDLLKLVEEKFTSTNKQGKEKDGCHNKCDWCGKDGGDSVILHKRCYESIMNGDGAL